MQQVQEQQHSSAEILTEQQHEERERQRALASFELNRPYLDGKKLLYFCPDNGSTVVESRDRDIPSRRYAIKRILGSCTLQEQPCRNVVRELIIHLWLTKLQAAEQEQQPDAPKCFMPLVDVYLGTPRRSSASDPTAPPLIDIYVVMPLAQHDLATVLRAAARSGSRISEEHIKSWAMQLLMAVRKMHALKLLHRDLSLGNILITETGELLLTDFGLSRLKDAERGSGESASSGAEQGTLKVTTVEYRAPELLLRHKAHDSRIDVWSVGCVIAEMFLRRGPIFRSVHRDDCHVLRTMMGVLGDIPVDQLDWLEPDGNVRAVVRRFMEQNLQTYNGRIPPYFSSLEEMLKMQCGASDNAVSLIRQLLTFDFRKRPLAEQALEHRWFDSLRDPTAAEDEEDGSGSADGEKQEEGGEEPERPARSSSLDHRIGAADEKNRIDDGMRECESDPAVGGKRDGDTSAGASAGPGSAKDDSDHAAASSCTDDEHQGAAGGDVSVVVAAPSEMLQHPSAGTAASSASSIMVATQSANQSVAAMQQQQQQQQQQNQQPTERAPTVRPSSAGDAPWLSIRLPPETDDVDSGNAELIHAQKMPLPALVAFLKQLAVRAGEFCEQRRAKELESS